MDEMDGGHMCVRAGVLEVDGWKIMVVYDGYEDGGGAIFADHTFCLYPRTGSPDAMGIRTYRFL